MSSYYDDASLMLLASGGAGKDGKVYSVKPTDGSGDFTFTRGSNLSATRVDASQLIEKGRENLILQSNQFDTTWVNSSSTETSGQSDKDGGTDAWLISTTGNGGRISQSFNSRSGVQRISVYAKAASSNWLLILANASSNGDVYFDLQNGAVGNVGNAAFDAQIESVGGGWYRCSFAGNYSSLFEVRIYPAAGDFDVSGNNSIYIQDAQLELGLVATPYIETGATTAQAGILENTPRFDYSGGATCPSLLLEPSRTNDIPQSEYFGSSGWGLLQASLTANNSNSPEGLQNAYSFVPNTTNNTHLVYETITKSAGTYSASCFFKADGYDYGNIRLATDSDAKRYSVTIDLTDGTFASQDTYGSPTSTGYNIENIGNGWYRLSVTSAHSSGFIYHTISLSNVASPTYNNGLPQFAGDGTKGVLIYGAQLEAGSYPTSYIPTYSVSQTRAADGQTLDITNFIGATEGTLFFELKDARSHSITNKILGIGDGSGVDNFFGLYVSDFSTGAVSIRNRQANADLMNTAIPNPNNAKVAIKFGASGVKTFLNGSEFQSSSTAYTGWASSFDLQTLCGDLNLKQYMLFPTALSDLDLAILTGATTYNTFAEMALALNYTVYE